MTLFDTLSEISDPRRPQGLRTNLSQLLSMVILSYLCGHVGYRGIARFSQSHSKTLTKDLQLKHQVPSYVTFRDVLSRLDQEELITAFKKWTSSFDEFSSDIWFSGDGKALGSTLSDCHTKEQNFQAIVSFFAQKSGLIYSIKEYQNKSKAEGEQDVVRFLIDELKLKGVIICLDALHTQKKQ